MVKRLHVHLVTPIEIAFDGDADSIIAPGTEGYLGVLPGHTYLFTSLVEGKLTLKVDANVEVYLIGPGYMEVHPSGAIIITEKANKI